MGSPTSTPLTVDQRIKQCVEEIKGPEWINGITDSTVLKKDLALESLELIELTMAVEEEFDLEISDAEMEAVTTYGELKQFLASKGVKE